MDSVTFLTIPRNSFQIIHVYTIYNKKRLPIERYMKTFIDIDSVIVSVRSFSRRGEIIEKKEHD